MPDCPVCNAEQAPRYRLDLEKPVNIATRRHGEFQTEEDDRSARTQRDIDDILRRGGGSPIDRAAKIAHKIAQDDHNLTDLRGSAGGDVVTHHVGEIGAPKLTPIQQRMADGWKQAQGGGISLPMAPGAGSLIEAARAATQSERLRDRLNGTTSPVHAALGAIRKTPQIGTMLARADAAGNIIKPRSRK